MKVLFLNLIPPSIPWWISEISVYNSVIGNKEFQDETDIVENQFAVGCSFISEWNHTKIRSCITGNQRENF